MEEADFLVIERELRDLCTQIGAPEIVEARFFFRRESYATPGFLLDPRSRVLEQLDALDRHLSLYDRSVFDRSMQKIGSILQQDDIDGPEGSDLPSTAVVVVASRSGTDSETIDLSTLPDLTELREQLRDLRKSLSEA